MKLLLFPLIFLVIFAFLSQLGVGSTTWEESYSLDLELLTGYMDANDHLVCYSNFTAAGEAGHLDFVNSGQLNIPYWNNGTRYLAHKVANGVTLDPATLEFNMGTSLGLIGLVIALIAVATVAGLKIFGSGVSDESVSMIVKGTALIAVWGIFSALSLNMIAGASFLGPFFWLFLTFIYTMGIINQVGHPGED